MARLNKHFLNHEGSTDALTFDLREGYDPSQYGALDLAGEVYVSVADAVRQARLFRATWQREVVRYIVHGVLHLRGFDDQNAAARKAMKREEDRLVRTLARHFDLEAIGR